MTQYQLEKAVELRKNLKKVNDSISVLERCTCISVSVPYCCGSTNIYLTPEIITQIMYIYEVEKQRIEQEISEL